MRLVGRSVVQQPAVLRHDHILVLRCLALLPLLCPFLYRLPSRTFLSRIPVRPCLSLSFFLSSLSPVLRSPVSRSTRNTVYIHTRVRRSFHPLAAIRARLASKVDDIACVYTLALRNFGETFSSSSRHFHCAGIRTMNKLACVIIAPT